jgi:hypothetical protein
MSKRFTLNILFALLAGSILAMGQSVAAEASMHDVYQAAESGHLREAQAMMQQVLRDHPNSAKAHYVEAELYAKAGQLDYASRELKTAQRLDPTMGFAKPEAVDALEAQLASSAAKSSGSASRSAFPWGYLLLGLGLIVALVLFLRALTQRNAMPAAPAPFGAAPPYGGYGPGYAPPGGGMGSGIMGGLVTGAAVGAGMVAGEALASRLMDGQHGSEHPDATPPSSDWDGNAGTNDNMGGNDFGVDDSSSWGGDSGGDIGGGDWS